MPVVVTISSAILPCPAGIRGGQRRGNPLVSSAWIWKRLSLGFSPAKRWLEELKTAGRSGPTWQALLAWKSLRRRHEPETGSRSGRFGQRLSVPETRQSRARRCRHDRLPAIGDERKGVGSGRRRPAPTNLRRPATGRVRSGKILAGQRPCSLPGVL